MLPSLLLTLILAQSAPQSGVAGQDSAGEHQVAADAGGAAAKSGEQGLSNSAGELTTQVVEHLGTTISETPLLGWIILFAGILGGLIVGKVAQTVLRQFAERLSARGWIARGMVFRSAAGPVNLALITAGLTIGFTGVVLDRDVAPFVGKIIGLLYVVSLGWFLFNLVDLVDVGIRRITSDSTILQLIRKALRIFLLIMFSLFVAENFFNANISAWLAGLGLAGLAVSLAAQGPIKNLFGSVTVVLDRPFGLGDRIQFSDKVGVVEKMGFRSTKLRTADGHLVTIPNSKLIEDVVENISARPYIRRSLNVTITYDTPPEKVELALKIIKDLLAQPSMMDTFNLNDFPPRVSFNNFNADSLNIAVMYWYQLNVEGRDWWTYLEQAESFNLQLLFAFNKAGIEFAVPTQTLFLAGDSQRKLAIHVASNGENLLHDGGQVRIGS